MTAKGSKGAKGSAAKGSAAKGSAAKGSAAKGSAAKGAGIIPRAPSEVRITGHGGPPSVGRVLAYRRVSTLEQEKQGNSLDLQKEEIRRYCDYAKLPDPVDFEETESASAEAQERREQIAKLLKQVRPGDLVVVSKIDRFSRDIVFTISAVREITKRGARFHSLAENFDPSTPEGETQMALWASIAQMERARIRERTEGNRKRLRAMGLFVEGKPPFGYVRAQSENPHEKARYLVIDPDKAPMIRDMFDLCLAGNSAVKISAIMQERYPGALNFDSEWILNALKNRVYAGQLALTAVRPKGNTSTIRRPAEWVPAHEPIVSLETWTAAQHALAGRRSYGAVARTESKTANWLMRGLARCAICGSMISSAPNSTTARRQHAGYYVCRARLQNRRGERCKLAPYHKQHDTDTMLAKEAEAHFDEIRSALALSPVAIPRPDGARFDAKRAELIAARERLLGLVMSGTWSMEVIDRKAKQIEGELLALAAEERQTVIEDSDDTVENRNGARQWVERAAARWPKLDAPKRRAVIAAMLERITIGSEKIAIVWADGAGMATRYAKGALPDLRGEAIEPSRPRRPAPRERTDTGEGLDMDAPDMDAPDMDDE